MKPTLVLKLEMICYCFTTGCVSLTSLNSKRQSLFYDVCAPDYLVASISVAKTNNVLEVKELTKLRGHDFSQKQ